MVEMTSTFVGRQRERELETLRNSMQNALKGKGSIVLIAGEEGIGKTELISEFLRSISTMDKKIRIARAVCRSGDAPFLPFSELGGKILEDISSEEGGEQVIRKLILYKEFLLGIIPKAIKFIPVIGEVASSGIEAVSEARKKYIEKSKEIKSRGEHILDRKETSQAGFYSEYAKFLQDVSKKSPLVLFIDDLELIDNSSARLLSHLSKEIKNYSILILGAYCPEDLTPRDGQSRPLKKMLLDMKPGDVTTINLKRLKPEDVRTYISQTYRGNSFPIDFIDFIYERTEKGNSLFMVELIKSLEEDKIIAKKDTKWSLTKEIRDIEANTPKKVEDVIKHRIANIPDEPDEDRKIHEYASVEGKRFTGYVLSKLLLSDGIELSGRKLYRGLGKLGKRYKLIREAEKSAERGTYEFTHPKIPNIFYDALGRYERVDLHQEISEILEAKYKQDNSVKEFAHELANHYEKGEIFDKALEYLHMAAESAENTNSFVEASSLYERANLIMKEKEIGTPKERVDILMKIGEIYQILGRGEEARDTLKESLDLNAKIGDDLIEASNLTNLGVTYFLLGELDGSINVLEKAKKTYKHHEEDLSNEALLTYGICLNWLGINYRNNSEFDKAMNFHQEALNIAKDVKNPRLEAHVKANIGAIHLWKGEFSQVIDKWEGSLKISRDAEDLPWEAHYTIDVGYMYFLERKCGEAVKYLEEGIEIAMEYYFQDNVARGLMNLGSVWFAKGDLEKAMKLYEEALEIAEMQKVTRLIWRLQHNIGNIYRKKEEYDNARKWYSDSIKSLEKMISTLKSEDEKKGFLEHRLDPFCSMILLTWEREEEESRKSAKTFGYDLLIDFLDDRKQGVDLNEKEAENWNFFDGYYVVTE